jgi:hypothetical protein
VPYGLRGLTARRPGTGPGRPRRPARAGMAVPGPLSRAAATWERAPAPLRPTEVRAQRHPTPHRDVVRQLGGCGPGGPGRVGSWRARAAAGGPPPSRRACGRTSKGGGPPRQGDGTSRRRGAGSRRLRAVPSPHTSDWRAHWPPWSGSNRAARRLNSSAGPGPQSGGSWKGARPCAPVGGTRWGPLLARSSRRGDSEACSAWWWRITPSPWSMAGRAGRFACHRHILRPLTQYGTKHSTKGLFHAVNWAAHCAGLGGPAARPPGPPPGLQHGVDTPVRTRAYLGAVLA